MGARQRSEVDDGRHGSLSLSTHMQGSSNLVHTFIRRGGACIYHAHTLVDSGEWLVVQQKGCRSISGPNNLKAILLVTTMQVFVRSTFNTSVHKLGIKTISLNVKPTLTIVELKRMVHKAGALSSPMEQKLTLAGEELLNSRTIESYNVRECTLIIESLVDFG